MSLITQFCCLLAIIQCCTIIHSSTYENNTPPDVETFEQFKRAHKKQYSSASEELRRQAAFLSNQQFIKEHNAKNESCKLGTNTFSDLTNRDFKKKFHGAKVGNGKISVSSPKRASASPIISDTVLPVAFSWVDEGYVTPVKDQGECGDCWSFAVTGNLEGQYFKDHGKLVSLSEQNLLDCTSTFATGFDAYGCNGSSLDAAITYIQMNGGINSESTYPYTGIQGSCNYTRNDPSYSPQAIVGGYTIETSDSLDETLLQQQLYSNGPISVLIVGSLDTFQNYQSGVYADLSCNFHDIDHAVLLVGWGYDSSGGPYWIVKNQWGTSWGIDGYAWMARNLNQCYIAQSPYIITEAKTTVPPKTLGEQQTVHPSHFTLITCLNVLAIVVLTVAL